MDRHPSYAPVTPSSQVATLARLRLRAARVIAAQDVALTRFRDALGLLEGLTSVRSEAEDRP